MWQALEEVVLCHHYIVHELKTKLTRDGHRALIEIKMGVRFSRDQEMTYCYKIGLRCEINGRQWQDQDKIRID